MSEIDLMLAIQLQAQFEEELRVSLEKQKQEQFNSKAAIPFQGSTPNKWRDQGGLLDESPQEKLSVSLIDPSWEVIDPNPDIHTLFLTFNDQFFWGRLAGVEVKWSPRMTLCAGVCSYEGRGGLCSVRLSVPLLKLRPRKDLIETLLHEMIHAYLFVTANNRDRDGHGPEFHKHMYRINSVAGTKISVFHSFHDEVDVYRQHVWQCDGPCRTRQPYFGLVKRAMNRAPGPRDPWWNRHQQSCGGSYTKIQEPEGYGDKRKNPAADAKKKVNDGSDIRKFIGFKGKGNSLGVGASGSSQVSKPMSSNKREKDVKNKFNERDSSCKENILHFVETNDSYGSRNNDLIDSNRNSDTVETNESYGSRNNDLIDSKRNSDAKPNNIHGIASTASGVVKQVSIDSASRSRVHGFDGGSPARKKPCNAPSGSHMGKPNAKTTGKPSRGFGSGTGLAVRGGGSRTVTVKGKTSTKAEGQVDDRIKMESPTPSSSGFQGQGFRLGGSTTRVSRLLTLSNSAGPSCNYTASASSSETEECSDTEGFFNSKRKVNQNEKMGSWISRSPTKGKSHLKGKKTSPSSQKSLDEFFPSSSSKLSDSSAEGLTRCPVCDTAISKRKINDHLDQCIVEFDNDDNWSKENKKKNHPCIEKSSTQSAKKELKFAVNGDDNECGDAALLGACSVSKISLKSEENSMKTNSEEELYPCPVCNDLTSQSDINQHLDSHF